MGEIGVSRRDFLYDMQFWEVDRIIRGYLKRDRMTHQLLAEVTYAAIYATRDPKGKTVTDMFPQLFESDDDDTESEPPITEEEQRELQELMDNINKKSE